MRRCTICGETKDLSEFHRNNTAVDGRQSRCKRCAIARVAEWQKANPEKFTANHKRYAQTEQGRRKRLESGRRTRAKHLATDEGRARLALQSRRSRIKKTYGITLEDYDLLVTRQGGVCAICGSPPGRRRLNVDHCHVSGRVRGLLCNGCNLAIGSARDDPAVLRRAIAYLEAAGDIPSTPKAGCTTGSD